MPFGNGIKTVRGRLVARSDECRTDVVQSGEFLKAEAGRIIGTVQAGKAARREHHRFRAGLTAIARDKPYRDVRLDMEGKAKKLLDQTGRKTGKPGMRCPHFRLYAFPHPPPHRGAALQE